MSFNFLLQADPVGIVIEEGADKGITVWSLMGDSSLLVNLLLLAIFGYAMYVFAERFMEMRRASREEDDFFSRVNAFLQEGNIDGAKKFCSNLDGPPARMLEKGIDLLGKPIEHISMAMESTAKIEVLRLNRRVHFLKAAAIAAPILGVLGTVVGLIVIFTNPMETTETVSLEAVAAQIITTAEGLIVGFISIIGYAYLVGRIGKVTYTMENTALEFMDVLNKPGK